LPFIAEDAVANYRVATNEQETAEGKVHVVWDMDMKKVISYFTRNRVVHDDDNGNIGAMAALANDPSYADTSPMNSARAVAHGADPNADFGIIFMDVDTPMPPTRLMPVTPASGSFAFDDGMLPVEGSSQSLAVSDLEGCYDAPSPSTWGQQMREQDVSEWAELVKELDGGHGDLRPFLPMDARVEYWSATHQRWLDGRLQPRFKTTTSPGGSKSGKPVVTYTVEVHTGGSAKQQRDDVPLNGFRSPLEANELIEVYTKGPSGVTWASGTITSAHQPMFHGYSVRVEAASSAGAGTEARVIENVPPSRLRRRFRAGDEVLVYKGPILGWASGVVEHATESSEEQTEQMKRQFSSITVLSGEMEWLTKVVQVPSDGNLESTLLGPRAGGSAELLAAGAEEKPIWSMVYVREHDVENTVATPSYLLAHKHISLANV